MTEFQELTQDAPNFVSMERGELVAYAYGMFAAGTKADAENAKLRKEFDKMDVWHSKELTAVMAENAKLRELARMMWLACKSNGIVGGIYAYPDKNSNADERIRFEPLLRELGVEVDR